MKTRNEDDSSPNINRLKTAQFFKQPQVSSNPKKNEFNLLKMKDQIQLSSNKINSKITNVKSKVND